MLQPKFSLLNTFFTKIKEVEKHLFYFVSSFWIHQRCWKMNELRKIGFSWRFFYCNLIFCQFFHLLKKRLFKLLHEPWTCIVKSDTYKVHIKIIGWVKSHTLNWLIIKRGQLRCKVENFQTQKKYKILMPLI